jgi:hypothetical protein
MKYEIETTNVFDRWLAGIKDITFRARIISRFDRVNGHKGHHGRTGATGMNRLTTRKWDAVEYLDSPEMIREYLKVSFEEGDSEQLMMAIGQVAKAQGISEIAKKALGCKLGIV